MKIFNLFLIAFCGLAFAQDSPDQDPKAAEILEKMSAATTGGNIDDIKTMVVVGTMEMPQNMSASSIMYYKQGGKILQKVTIEAMGVEQVSGCDGDECFMVDPMMGARILEGQEKESMIQQSDPAANLKWRDNYRVYRYEGEDTFEDKPVHKVYMESKAGLKQTSFIDAESFLTLKNDVKMSTPMGNMNVVQIFRDYRDVHEGFLLPFRIDIQMMQQNMALVTEEVEINTEIPDSKFTLPASLQK